MDFKIRPSGFLLVRAIVIGLCLLLACLDFFWPLSKNGLLHYNYILYSVMTIVLALQIYREFYFTFSNKTLLSIDTSAIHDFYNEITYYWKDIEALHEKNGYLYLSVYHTEEYLERIGNLRYRTIKKFWYKPGGKHNEFLVNLNLADADNDELSALLHNYSVNQSIK